jgi:outer membrane protein TolC
MAQATSLEADALERELVAMARMTYAELWGLQEQATHMAAFGRQLEQYRDAALAQYAAGRGPQQAVLGIQVEGGMLAQRLEALEEQRSALAARITALTGGRVRIAATDRLAPPAAVARCPVPLRPAQHPARRPRRGITPQDADAYRAAVAAHPMVEAGRAMQSAEQAMAR